MGYSRKTSAGRVLLATVVIGVLQAAGPPTGRDSNETLTISAVFLDAVAQKAAAGSDFTDNYTVLDVTVTPAAGKTIQLQPDDFLLRVNSNADHSGPVSANEVLGSGGLVVKKGERVAVGINLNDTGYASVTAASGANSASDTAAIAALKAKMLPAGDVSTAARGLLFFPIAKKKPKDLDLVYSIPPDGHTKLHVMFH